MSVQSNIVENCGMLPSHASSGQKGRLRSFVNKLSKSLEPEHLEFLLNSVYPLVGALRGFNPESFFKGLQQKGAAELLSTFQVELAEFCEKHQVSEEDLPSLLEEYYEVIRDIQNEATSLNRFQFTSGSSKRHDDLESFAKGKSLKARRIGPLLNNLYNSIIDLVPEDQRVQTLISSTNKQAEAALSSYAGLRLRDLPNTNTRGLVNRAKSLAVTAQIEDLQSRLEALGLSRPALSTAIRKYAQARRHNKYPEQRNHQVVGDIVYQTQQAILKPFRSIPSLYEIY